MLINYLKNSKQGIFFIILIGLVVSLTVGIRAQSSAFTYQGRLNENSTAANGSYQFQFKLFDAASDGTQIGTTLSDIPATVTNGIFTVQLDFGAAAFGGGARYLEISVRQAGNPNYTTLNPRQPLTSAPYSIRTISAFSADSLSNACVGCVQNSQINSVSGDKITSSVPNANTAQNVSGVVPITNGGTGSATQNFVDLSSEQSNIGGDKTFRGNVSVTGLNSRFIGNGSGLTNVVNILPITGGIGIVPKYSYQFVSSPAVISLTSPSQKITGSVSLVMFVAGALNLSAQVGLCYQSTFGGGGLVNFADPYPLNSTVSATPTINTISASASIGSTGIFNIGPCINYSDSVAVMHVNSVNGWIMLSN